MGLKQLLSAIFGLPKSLSSDRRGSARYPCYVETFCRAEGQASDLSWLGCIRDVSTGGLRLHVSRRFERADDLTVELPERDDSVLPPRLDVQVVRVCKSRSGDGWDLGCALRDRPLSDPELKALL